MMIKMMISPPPQVGLLGDSLMQQTLDAMYCEAQLRGLRADVDPAFQTAMREVCSPHTPPPALVGAGTPERREKKRKKF